MRERHIEAIYETCAIKAIKAGKDGYRRIKEIVKGKAPLYCAEGLQAERWRRTEIKKAVKAHKLLEKAAAEMRRAGSLSVRYIQETAYSVYETEYRKTREELRGK